MANHKSAKKRILQNRKRAMRNKFWRSTMRTYTKQVRVAVEGGEKAAAQEALGQAIRVIARCGTKGVIHKNQVSRRISRLTLLCNTL